MSGGRRTGLYHALRVFEAFPQVMAACNGDWTRLPGPAFELLAVYCMMRDEAAGNRPQT